jgi:hypothetical protein
MAKPPAIASPEIATADHTAIAPFTTASLRRRDADSVSLPRFIDLLPAKCVFYFSRSRAESIFAACFVQEQSFVILITNILIL